MTEDLKLGLIGQIARRVQNIETATIFFRDTLGLPHLYSYGPLAFFNAGGVRLFLQEGEGHIENSILYFRVDDIHAAAAALKARGVVFIDEPHLIHRHPDGVEEWMTFFKDPGGEPLALMSQIRP
ncbi:MAG: VOC family protein [Rhodospirillaceae bacterium]